MEQVDHKKLEIAIQYIQRIADGNNPVNNMPAEDDSVLNNPNVIRCMFFVKEVLEEVERNGGYIGKKQAKKDLPDFPLEVLNNYVYQEDKPITKFVEQINSLIDTDLYKKLYYKPITDFLKENGYLEVVAGQGKSITRATEMGKQIGIYSEERTSINGQQYIATIYGKTGQEFIIANIDKILEGEHN